MNSNRRYSARTFRVSILLLEALLLLATQFVGLSLSAGQTHSRDSNKQTSPAVQIDLVERAVNNICVERKRDRQATVPIDEMASSRLLPLTDARAVAGRLRAQTLLPVAKRLLPFALKRLASGSGSDLDLAAIVTRIRSVDVIKAEVEERDNSAWRPNDPKAIVFGTVFLTGLRSDEAMLAVLAHELTHAVNGTDGRLEPLFSRVATRTSRLGTPISFRAATELSCELAGIEVVRDYISQTKGRGTKTKQRLARPFGKDCVRIDLSDQNHLSPLETMRMILRIEPSISSALAGERVAKQAGKRKRQPPRSGRKK